MVFQAESLGQMAQRVAALQAAKSTSPVPRALPWAMLSDPFGVKNKYLHNLFNTAARSLSYTAFRSARNTFTRSFP